MAKRKQDIFQIVDQLEKTKEEIHQLLNDSKSKGHLENEQTAFLAMEEVLKLIGRGLYQAAVRYSQEEQLKFYFWPGYTTLNGTRILIKGELTQDEGQNEEMFTGIGFHRGVEFFNCPSTLYYDAIVADMKDSGYFGPTTHHWKRQQGNSISIQLKDETPLKVLLIESSFLNKSKSGKGLYHIKFNKEEIEKVVQYISKKLAFKSPLLRIDGNESEYKPWPLNKPNDLTISDKRFKQLAIVQKLVYPVWFAATFSELLQSKPNKQKVNDWLSSIIDSVNENGYYDLAARIKKFRDCEEKYLEQDEQKYKPAFFSHWYSLFFDTKTHKQELGSAMILTDRQLSREFLFYASSWLQQIYGLLRMEESAVIIRTKAWKENFTKLSHSQNQYFEAMKEYVNTSNIGEEQKTVILHYHELLQGFLEVAKNFDDLNTYVARKSANDTIELFSELQDSVATLKLLFANTEILKHSFKLLSDGEKYLENFRNKSIFAGNFTASNSLNILANKAVFKLLIKDLLVNAIENSDESNPIVEITIKEENEFAILKIENNSAPSEQELQGIINPDLLSGKYGLQIIKALRTALGWEMNFPTDLMELEKTNKFYFEFKIPIV